MFKAPVYRYLFANAEASVDFIIYLVIFGLFAVIRIVI